MHTAKKFTAIPTDSGVFISLFEALTGKKTKGVLIVVFVGGKPYIGTMTRQKQSIRYPMRVKKSATSEALPMWHLSII